MNPVRTRAMVVATVVAVVGGLLAALIAPWPARLGGTDTGDAALAAEVRAVIDDPGGYRGLAVARIVDGQVRTAGLGDRTTGLAGASGEPVTPDTPFEIGSIGKTLTGMVLADQIADGQVDADTTLAEALPDQEFGDPAVGEITLAELASHRSGLPRLPPVGLAETLTMSLGALRGTDPYTGLDTDRIRETLADAEVGDGRGEVDYSNFGMALLGIALAEQADTSFPELVRREIFDPLGLADTGYALDGAAVPDGAATGGMASGKATEPWQASGLAGAGIGPWSTAPDLATLVAAMLDGSAPGADAAQARFDAGEDSRIGYSWFTTSYDGREIVWHNGATSGFRSYVGYDPATGDAVVVLGNTDKGVEPIGLSLLGVAVDDDPTGAGPLMIGVTVLLLLAGAVTPVLAALGGRRRWLPAADRLKLVTSTLTALIYLLIVYGTGAWHDVWAGWWALAAGLAAGGAATGALRWRQLPLIGSGRRWLRWTGAALTGTVAALLLALVVLFS
ncbi:MULTISPECIES: serine hydrolase domain-containing protein [unclassified Solwaraspora]|uniref:serine hydrolase domain-containing protein n=1 Tax=unclassified Solwaraspora TaxID=2627926 RepID=UPI00259BBE94|nr:serine hydrolase domain-containing protein [Solwaraspora sp. WMMA2056]WJK39961.1 serine hydrolase domain-containing protein [Solwaraspora sp. WMMA2056]